MLHYVRVLRLEEGEGHFFAVPWCCWQARSCHPEAKVGRVGFLRVLENSYLSTFPHPTPEFSPEWRLAVYFGPCHKESCGQHPGVIKTLRSAEKPPDQVIICRIITVWPTLPLFRSMALGAD